MNPSWLPEFWAVLTILAVFVYAVRDGYDLGVGILFGLSRGQAEREAMARAIAPFWDGNEVWLVLVGTLLFAAFPPVYAIVLPAFYLPLTLMLLALIFRGVSFEFRHHDGPGRGFWDWGFALGSLLTSFVQGAAVGGILQGIPVAGLEFSGGTCWWLAPFPVLCGVALVLADCLLGAAWLALRTEGALRSRSYGWLRLLTPALLAAALGLAAFLAAIQPRIAARWLQHPSLFILPAAGLLICGGLWAAIRTRRDALPYRLATALFLIGIAALAGSVWPYLIPFSVTVVQAAAPAGSLGFLFTGGGLLAFPLVLLCMGMVSHFLRGKW